MLSYSQCKNFLGWDQDIMKTLYVSEFKIEDLEIILIKYLTFWSRCSYIFYCTQYKIQDHSKIEPNKRRYHTFLPAGKALYKSLYMVRVSQP